MDLERKTKNRFSRLNKKMCQFVVCGDLINLNLVARGVNFKKMNNVFTHLQNQDHEEV